MTAALLGEVALRGDVPLRPRLPEPRDPRPQDVFTPLVFILPLPLPLPLRGRFRGCPYMSSGRVHPLGWTGE